MGIIKEFIRRVKLSTLVAFAASVTWVTYATITIIRFVIVIDLFMATIIIGLFVAIIGVYYSFAQNSMFEAFIKFDKQLPLRILGNN